MKNLIKILTMTPIVLLASCESSNYELYKDSKPIVDDKITIRFDDFQENDESIIFSRSLSFKVYFLSVNPKQMNLELKSAMFYREKDNAEYRSTYFFSDTYVLECDKEFDYSFSASLPSLTTVDNYKFVLKYNSKTLVYHLYDNPKGLDSTTNSLKSSTK